MSRTRPANRYWILRHGHSQANALGLVVSDPQRGRDAFGLTDTGRTQVRATLDSPLARRIPATPVIVSSPFLRAVESAQLAAAMLGVSAFSRDARLRERFFGTLELEKDCVYADVWEADRENPGHVRWGVEAVTAVRDRLAGLLADLDRQHPDRCVLLVAHGDVASTLLCWAAGEDLCRHREVGALPTAGLAELEF